MTKKECAIIMAYTGICMLHGEDFKIFHKYVEEKLGRLVNVHEMIVLEERIKKASRSDFIELCRNATNSD